MILTELHKAICRILKKEIPAIQACEVYPTIRREIIAPAVFVELVSLEPGKDPGTEELALRARFEARIVVDGTVEDSQVAVRELAAAVARVVNKNTWNVENVSAGEFISGGGVDFSPELDAYLVWMVEWVHTIHVGRSIWEKGKFRPHKIEIGEINVRK